MPVYTIKVIVKIEAPTYGVAISRLEESVKHSPTTDQPWHAAVAEISGASRSGA
jgi:hypothetical protein